MFLVSWYFYILMETEIRKAAEERDILGEIQGEGAGVGGARGPSTGSKAA